MAYTPTIWENLPSTNTPINKDNLNKLENQLESTEQNLETTNTDVQNLENKIKEQKILWQDEGSFMNENQTASLNENVSNQKTGIVLIFSSYANGQSQNYGWYEYFIPKTIVDLRPAGGHSILIPDNDVTYGVKAAKYLYVSDTQIRGNANNVGTHGNLNNSSVVLRYIIGI